MNSGRGILSLMCAALFLMIINHEEARAIEGVCVPTPPCYCDPECFKCGPGGCVNDNNSGSSIAPAEETVDEQDGTASEGSEQSTTDPKAKEKRNKEFETAREKTLNMLKGADSSEFGVKGTDQGLGLKTGRNQGQAGPADARLKGLTPSTDSGTVDLRHLDPDKAITVDPNVVKGKERQIPVQVSDHILSNENYIKGFDAIIAGDPSAAVQHFLKVRQDLGDSPLVRNALAFAEDLKRTRTRNDQHEMALREAYKGIVAALDRDYLTAVELLESAMRLDPSNEDFSTSLELIKNRKQAAALRAHLEEQADRRTAEENRMQSLSSSVIVAVQNSDYDTAIRLLEEMLSIEDIKPTRELLDAVRGWRNEAGQPKKLRTQDKETGK